jgi:small subunit ribosomal protein S8
MINHVLSDMLNRLVNGARVKKKIVKVKSTRLTQEVANLLLKEGFIEKITASGATDVDQRSKSAYEAGQELLIHLKYRDRSLNIGKLASRSPERGTANEKSISTVLSKGKNLVPVFTNVKSLSTPGVRLYAGTKEIPAVLGGLGITLISTSRGILTDHEARRLGLGGEVLCMVW